MIDAGEAAWASGATRSTGAHAPEVVLAFIASRNDAASRSAIVRTAPTALATATLILVAALVDGTAQVGIWIGALALAYVTIGSAPDDARAGWEQCPENDVRDLSHSWPRPRGRTGASRSDRRRATERWAPLRTERRAVGRLPLAVRLAVAKLQAFS